MRRPQPPALGCAGLRPALLLPQSREGLGCGESTGYIDPREGRGLYRLLFDGFPGGGGGKEPPAVQKTRVRSLGWEDPLEEGTAPHSSTLALRVPSTEEPGGLQSTGSLESWT